MRVTRQAFRRSFLLLLGAATAFAGGIVIAQRGGRQSIAVKPGEECPPGTTLSRVGECSPPEFPPPSILDYRPRNTLVTDKHLVPKAKFPVIDYHGHATGRLTNGEGIAGMVAALDALNVRVLIAADNVSGANLQRTEDALKASPYKDRFRAFTGISFAGVGTPGWADRAIAQLEADAKAGAIGVGEISKSFGLRTRKADGTLLKVDDPELDPVWDACGRLNLPVFIHTAEPQEFFQPIDFHNERWLELSLFGDRRYPDGQFPRFEELLTQQHNLFRKHPKTRFVAAHLGWLGNDLGRLGRLLDEMPNVYSEVGAVLYDLGRQPRAAREFLIKYQDRILFGKDLFEPTEYPYYWRVFETKDDYFDYYRNYHAFWKLYGLDLPDAVLKKLYYQNAIKITPGLPTADWPK